jgi:uncharacterized zinc-type alcohol dehydrogenase-like protein
LLGLLGTDGAMVNVGAPAEPLPVDVFSLLTQRRSFAGSAIGSIRETQEMRRDRAHRRRQINETWQRMLASDVRYRFVIDTATLKG